MLELMAFGVVIFHFAEHESASILRGGPCNRRAFCIEARATGEHSVRRIEALDQLASTNQDRDPLWLTLAVPRNFYDSCPCTCTLFHYLASPT
jgi:hypothetical protein